MIKDNISSCDIYLIYRFYEYILHGFCRSVMNLRMLWKRGGTLWTIMAVISFPSDGLIMWLYFKLIIPFCMTVWAGGMGSLGCSWMLIFAILLYISALTYFLHLCDRGYKDSKLSNNIECEIFQVLLEEAKQSYPEDIVVAMKSDTIEDISRNVATLTDLVRNWSSLS